MLEMLNLDDKNATHYRHYCIYHTFIIADAVNVI